MATFPWSSFAECRRSSELANRALCMVAEWQQTVERAVVHFGVVPDAVMSVVITRGQEANGHSLVQIGST